MCRNPAIRSPQLGLRREISRAQPSWVTTRQAVGFHDADIAMRERVEVAERGKQEQVGGPRTDTANAKQTGPRLGRRCRAQVVRIEVSADKSLSNGAQVADFRTRQTASPQVIVRNGEDGLCTEFRADTRLCARPNRAGCVQRDQLIGDRAREGFETRRCVAPYRIANTRICLREYSVAARKVRARVSDHNFVWGRHFIGAGVFRACASSSKWLEAVSIRSISVSSICG